MEKIRTKQTMNESTIKTIVVHLPKTPDLEFEVDVDVFDDPCMEAVTRAIELSRRKKKYAPLVPFIMCWDKDSPKKEFLYNAYWALVNASYHTTAELLREKFKLQHDVDLAEQPYHAIKKHVGSTNK